MNIRVRKAISGIIAALAAVIYAALLSPAYEVAPNGTIESGGIGRAIEMLVVGAVIYGLVWFLTGWLAGHDGKSKT